MTPPLPPELFPGILMSGSSEAGLAAARAVGATAVKYPKPAKDSDPNSEMDGERSGVRVGSLPAPKAKMPGASQINDFQATERASSHIKWPCGCQTRFGTSSYLK